jgi:hypothetical protein
VRFEELGRAKVAGGAMPTQIGVQVLVGGVNAEGVKPDNNSGVGTALFDLFCRHDPRIFFVQVWLHGRALPFFDSCYREACNRI